MPELPFFNGRVDGESTPFDAWADRPLLQSLEEGGLQWPSSCRNGSCRTCLGRLVSGRVSYRIEWPGLTAEEQAAGDVLPCVAHPESDVCLAPPGP